MSADWEGGQDVAAASATISAPLWAQSSLLPASLCPVLLTPHFPCPQKSSWHLMGTLIGCHSLSVSRWCRGPDLSGTGLSLCQHCMSGGGRECLTELLQHLPPVLGLQLPQWATWNWAIKEVWRWGCMKTSQNYEKCFVLTPIFF